MPWPTRLDEPAPTMLVELTASGALLAYHGQRHLVGRLVLVEAVARQRGTVAGQEMHRVLDCDFVEYQVRRVGDQAVHGAKQPLAGVDDVGQRVLDRPAAC